MYFNCTSMNLLKRKRKIETVSKLYSPVLSSKGSKTYILWAKFQVLYLIQLWPETFASPLLWPGRWNLQKDGHFSAIHMVRETSTLSPIKKRGVSAVMTRKDNTCALCLNLWFSWAKYASRHQVSSIKEVFLRGKLAKVISYTFIINIKWLKTYGQDY